MKFPSLCILGALATVALCTPSTRQLGPQAAPEGITLKCPSDAFFPSTLCFCHAIVVGAFEVMFNDFAKARCLQFLNLPEEQVALTSSWCTTYVQDSMIDASAVVAETKEVAVRCIEETDFHNLVLLGCLDEKPDASMEPESSPEAVVPGPQTGVKCPF